jgi:hypothetical protein
MKKPIVIVLLTVALILVCLGIGVVVFFAANDGFQGNSPFDNRNVASKLEESKTIEVDTEDPLTLTIYNAAGDVTITGGDVDAMQIDVVKTAFDSTQARADDEVKYVNYTIEQDGNNITIKYDIPKSMNFNNKINTVDFIITVPNETTIDVDTGFGEVSVANTKGNAKIRNDFGDVTLENLEGGLTVQTNSGEVNATSITAGSEAIDLHSDFGAVILKKAGGRDITLDSSSGKITLSEVRATGKLTAGTDYGNVKFDNGSAASSSYTTKSGEIELTSVNISGLLMVVNDFGNLTLDKVNAKSYDIVMSSGSIKIDGAQGSVKAHTKFGNITLTNAKNATLDLVTQSGTIDFEGTLGDGPHTIHSDFGGIEITLPADTALNVDLETEFGKVKSDIPISIVLTEELTNSHWVGTTNDGGSEFKVSTKSGDITIRSLGE